MESEISTTSPQQSDSSTAISYAGFWQRTIASCIDSFIILLPSLLFGWLIPVAGSILIGILYKPFFESSALMGTPGKALMGLRVVSENFERISFKTSFIRYVGTFLSSITLGIGYLMAAFTEKKQTLHDMVAKTVVIQKQAPAVNYIECWTDEVTAVFTGLRSAPKAPTIVDNLEDLQELYKKGLITESEYIQKKADILAKF